MDTLPTDPRDNKSKETAFASQSEEHAGSEQQNLEHAGISEMALVSLNSHRQSAAFFANKYDIPVAICLRTPSEFGFSELPYLNLLLDKVDQFIADGTIQCVIEIVYPAVQGAAGRVIDIDETQQRINEAIEAHLSPGQAEDLRRYFGLGGRPPQQDPEEARTTARAIENLASGGLDPSAFLTQKVGDSHSEIDPKILRALRKPKKQVPPPAR